MSEKRNLPTIEELHSNIEVYEKKDKANYLLNQNPPEKWVKKHPYVSNHLYLPIDKVEYLLRNIFREYKIEILREGTFFNAVYVAVRVHYRDLVTGDWLFHDGAGAQQLQVKKGESVANLNAINNGAVAMALPIAKTLAVKDACDHFGKIFGSDLNRKDVLEQRLSQTNEEKAEEIKELLEDENVHIPEKERMNIERILENKETVSYKKALRILNNAKSVK